MLLPSSSEAEVHTAWLAAGANGDVGVMRQLLGQFTDFLDLERIVHPTVTFCDWKGFRLQTLGASALHTAAWDGKLKIVQFLLELGQDPDARDDSGTTAVMVAILRLTVMTMRCILRDGEAVRRNVVVDCRQEQSERMHLVLEVIKVLLQFGANVDAQSQDGKTALHCSTCDDAFEVAKFLLDAGASIDVQDENGKTPLHYCVKEEGLFVANLLLSRGADIDVEDMDGITPLALTLQRANLNMLQLFLNHHELVAIPARRDFGAALLLQAVDFQSEKVVRFIVETAYAPVSVRNAKGETPMHRAIMQRNSVLMALLADMDPAGDTLVATTEEQKTPAHYMVEYGSTREVQTLLGCLTTVFGDLEELGLTNPLNFTDTRGFTSLYIAGFAADSAVSDLDTRDSLVCLLVSHGGRLFPPNFLSERLILSNPDTARIIFPIQVRRCLEVWLTESQFSLGEPEGEESAATGPEGNAAGALTELCMAWMASVTCVGSWASLLPILICTGYAHNVVPLLLELPLERSALPALLRQLEKFSRHQITHPLLLQLHDELLEAFFS